MKTLLGYAIVAYLAFALVLTFYASHYDDIPDVYLSKAEPLDFPKAPDFAKIDNVKTKKQTFFNYLRPIVDRVNSNIQNERDTLLSIQDSYEANADISRHAHKVIKTLAKKYKVDISKGTTEQHIQKLLLRVNIIPSSLALAQAANESGWGSSRFATQGNNYFGMWCYSKGCGYVPKSRGSNAKHEVREFSSPASSVKAYIHNINTHNAYKHLRKLRQQAEQKGIAITGEYLANGLINYSERREEYITEIQSMIRSNKLDADRLILTTD